MKKILSAALSILLAVGCAKEYDDSAIKGRLDAIEEQATENANALKKLSNMLEEATLKGMTVSVTPVTGGNKYTFSDGTVLTVMDGAQGLQGPQGQPGEDGVDTIVSIKESADGLSYVITMDGKEYIVGKTLSFSLKLQTTELALVPGESKDIAYTLTEGEGAVVFISACSGYTAVVDMETSKVTVTAPVELPDNGFIVLTARKATGEEYSQYIGFLKGNLTVTADAETVEAEGAVVTLTVNADCSYNVVIPEDCTWIERVESKAMSTSYVYLKVAANLGASPRTATVKILSSAGTNDIVIAQKASVKVMEAANSFIVSEAGSYNFRAVKGNSSETVGNVASCTLLWESFGNATVPEVNSLISSVSYANDIVSFSTASAFTEGNAVIAAKDADGKILWSWHIWLTDQPEEHTYYNNAGTVMDRNLGALSAVPGEVEALGLLYQWGRKDPFLDASTRDDSADSQAGSTITWPEAVTSDATTGTIEYTLANPTTYIVYTSTPNNGDWYYTGDTSADNTRWSPDTKTVYDPCPAGWRVPGSDFYKTAAPDMVSCTFTDMGTNLSGKVGDASNIWYPAAGYRAHNSGGGLSSQGSQGYYWFAFPSSSTPKYASCLFFQGNGNFQMSSVRRARGNSVRCVKE